MHSLSYNNERIARIAVNANRDTSLVHVYFVIKGSPRLSMALPSALAHRSIHEPMRNHERRYELAVQRG